MAESGLRRWPTQHEIDSSAKEGLWSSEPDQLVRLRRESRTLRVGWAAPRVTHLDPT